MQKTEFILPTSGKDLDKIKNAVKEASDAQLQIDSLKEHLALIRSDLTDELGLPAKLFNKLLKTYHKQTYGEEVKQAEEFQETYEAIFERK